MSLIEKIKDCDNPKELMCSFLAIKHRLLSPEVGVATSFTDPVGQYAEYLTLKAFGGKRTPNGTKGLDIIDKNKRKIEVKGRIKRDEKYTPKTDISHSNVEAKTFEYLVYIVFSQNFEIEYAFGTSLEGFKKIAQKVKHKGRPEKWIFKAKESLTKESYVDDLTEIIRKVNT
ncbi:hypothetical protein M2F98_21115 [Vibrio vulnificus]|nr:hypothetical protein [Vibrio vulnificus]